MQIIEPELEDGLGGHATNIWTDDYDFAGASHRPRSRIVAEVLEHGHGRDHAVLVACLPAKAPGPFDALDHAVP